MDADLRPAPINFFIKIKCSNAQVEGDYLGFVFGFPPLAIYEDCRVSLSFFESQHREMQKLGEVSKAVFYSRATFETPGKFEDGRNVP